MPSNMQKMGCEGRGIEILEGGFSTGECERKGRKLAKTLPWWGMLRCGFLLVRI
jgi:hypothetical protein